MAPMGSALSAIATLLPNLPKKETAAGIAVAARKCARRKAAPLLLEHVASVASMVLVACASSMDAPPTQHLVFHYVSYTAVETRSRAPWRAALPTLKPEVSVANTVVVQVNVGLQVAPTRWSAGSRLA